jgi:ubiquinone/menaquinone biosynthesis C-methylase UbiE
MPIRPDNERVREYYERSAVTYDRNVRRAERWLRISEARHRLCSLAKAEVLEIGVGTGRNLSHYPTEGVRLTAVDLSPAMLAIARERSAALGISVSFVEGDAQALAFPENRFDTVLVTFALCSVPDDRKAVAEAVRVLRPGGLFLLMEHVRSPNVIVRGAQHLLEPLSLRFQSDHLLREPLEHVRALGLDVEQLDRWGWGFIESILARKSR